MDRSPAPPTTLAMQVHQDYAPQMSDSDAPLRAQLNEAIDRVRRQLEILRSPSSIGGGADNREAIAELETELRGLEDARGAVGPNA